MVGVDYNDYNDIGKRMW